MVFWSAESVTFTAVTVVVPPYSEYPAGVVVQLTAFVALTVPA